MHEDSTAVEQILICVIGDTLLQADASFLFGHDFSDIIKKYSPLLACKDIQDEMLKNDIEELKTILSEMHKTQPFLGNSYQLLTNKLEAIESQL